MSKVRVVSVTLILVTGLTQSLCAQWNNGVAEHISAMVRWDPDGAGPKREQLVVGGFGLRDGSLDDNVALYDPETGHWSDLGRGYGVDGAVRALAVLPSGELVAGGYFEAAGSVLASRVARWDGVRWHAFGDGIGERSSVVHALAVHPDGSLGVGGSFTIAGRIRAPSVAVWGASDDGKREWRALGLGVDGRAAVVEALSFLPGGDLVIGGEFTFAGTERATGVARWNGEEWLPLGHCVDGAVATILPLPKGELLIGGAFERAGAEAATNIARWDGERWHALAAGVESRVSCMATLPNGDVLVGSYHDGVLRWDGSTWHEVGDLHRAVSALVVMPDGVIFAGGAGLHRFTGGGFETILERNS